MPFRLKTPLPQRLIGRLPFLSRLSHSEYTKLCKVVNDERSNAKRSIVNRVGLFAGFPLLSGSLSYVALRRFAYRNRDKGVYQYHVVWLCMAELLTMSNENNSGMFCTKHVRSLLMYSTNLHSSAIVFLRGQGYIERVSAKDLKRWTFKLPKKHFRDKDYYLITEEGKNLLYLYRKEYNKVMDHAFSYGVQFNDLMKHEHTNGYLYKILSWFNHDKDKFFRCFVDDEGDLTKPIDLKVKNLKKYASDFMDEDGKFTKERNKA